jgi:hypothetical protein
VTGVVCLFTPVTGFEKRSTAGKVRGLVEGFEDLAIGTELPEGGQRPARTGPGSGT